MMSAYDATKKAYELTRDALKLAEMSKPYKDGEQWAVNAVIFLRSERARRLQISGYALRGLSIPLTVIFIPPSQTEKFEMDAYDAAKKAYELTRDALKLAEMSKPYKDGEQWAVNAVIFLRLECKRQAGAYLTGKEIEAAVKAVIREYLPEFEIEHIANCVRNLLLLGSAS